MGDGKRWWQMVWGWYSLTGGWRTLTNLVPELERVGRRAGPRALMITGGGLEEDGGKEEGEEREEGQ